MHATLATEYAPGGGFDDQQAREYGLVDQVIATPEVAPRGLGGEG